ncbi:MAG: tol-pal system protein YbgF [Burkholderiaceae bacterium]
MKSFTALLATVAMIAAACAPVVAHAGLFDDDEARRAILDARTRIDNLQRELNSRMESKADKSAMLELANQNEQLRLDTAKLRGQIEVLTNDLANAQQRQKDFYVDLDSRLRKLEPQKVTVDGQEASVEQGEQRTYDGALALFKAGDFKASVAAFTDFMHRYPQSGYAAAAQYWLGTSYYAQRDYRNAIVAQQTVVKTYPDSTRAPDALLNIATCYVELKDKPQARRTLETLIARYPDSAAAHSAKERIAALR